MSGRSPTPPAPRLSEGFVVARGTVANSRYGRLEVSLRTRCAPVPRSRDDLASVFGVARPRKSSCSMNSSGSTAIRSQVSRNASRSRMPLPPRQPRLQLPRLRATDLGDSGRNTCPSRPARTCRASIGEERPHDVHVLLRHRLPPFLGEAFGGSTGLVDVAWVGQCAREPPADDPPLESLVDRTITPRGRPSAGRPKPPGEDDPSPDANTDSVELAKDPTS